MDIQECIIKVYNKNRDKPNPTLYNKKIRNVLQLNLKEIFLGQEKVKIL